MIQLGLSRAAQLFSKNPQPWRAVHVAGTNGKGTVCAYLSALLHSGGITCGRFTSPHLIDRWDCITINEKPVSESLFRKVEATVLQRNRDENINATEFELLTATAFDIFTHENVAVAVVEVGMGGRDDATNILKSKDLTVITRIGLDHQSFLGNTLEEIAVHKCGIFVKDVPVLYSAANPPSVVRVFKAEAQRVGASPVWPVDAKGGLPNLPRWEWERFAKRIRDRDQQKIAIGLAWGAYWYLSSKVAKGNDVDDADEGSTVKGEDETGRSLPTSSLAPEKPPPNKRSVDTLARARDAIINLTWPGRMQRLDVETLVPGGGNILLDGAHNTQAAEMLNEYVETELRTPTSKMSVKKVDDEGEVEGKARRVSWVVGTTQGRDVSQFLNILLQPGDRVACVEFGVVDGMPWVKALPAEEIEGAALGLHPDLDVKRFGRDIKSALEWAVEPNADGEQPVVVTGSLYLAGDLLRLFRDAGADIYGTNIDPEEDPEEKEA